MPAAKKTGDDAGKSDPKQPVSGQPAWDPAAVPPHAPSLAEQEERQFHATHFTADPRGAAMSGKPPAGTRRRKHRGGTPPDESAGPDTPKREDRPKRRG